MNITIEAGEEKKSKFHDHEIKHAMDTLVEAEKIKANPELMEHVTKEAQKHKKAITSVADLKAKIAEMDEADLPKAPTDETTEEVAAPKKKKSAEAAV
jgi:hypothetical protein